jgi:hypothetical protein
MRAALILAFVLASGCALKGDPASACSDPLGLYTSRAYEPCCRAHDDAYEVGGGERERLKADQALYTCVSDRGSEDDAASMFYAVRLGGRDRFTYTKD